MEKELERYEGRLKAEIHIDSLRLIVNKHQIGKPQAIMEYMDSVSRNSLSFMKN